MIHVLQRSFFLLLPLGYFVLNWGGRGFDSCFTASERFGGSCQGPLAAVYSCNRYLLSTYCMPGVVLVPKVEPTNKTKSYIPVRGGGSGLRIQVYPPAPAGAEAWAGALAKFHGVNSPTVAHCQPPTWCDWTQRQEEICTIGFREPFCTKCRIPSVRKDRQQTSNHITHDVSSIYHELSIS